LKKQGSRGRSKKIPQWVCGMVLGVHLLGCASPPPKSEAPLPPLRRTPTVQQASPAIPDFAPQEPAPAASANVAPGPPKSGSAPGQPAPEPPQPLPAAPAPKDAFHVHVVRWTGETLSAVAAWYTGDAKNWKMLAEASPEINPNLIHEGNKIFIPDMLLKTREPMPRNFLDRFYSKSKKEKPRSKPQPAPVAQDGELQLFGPKKSPLK
jgi:nucleoid-associated protein YgaU